MDFKHLEKIFPFHVFDPATSTSRSDELMLTDYFALLRLLEEHQPKNILEIGAWTGSCTCLFGGHVKGRGGKVHSIDNFKGSPGSEQARYAEIARRRFFENIKTFGLKGTVIFHEGDSDEFVDLDEKFDLIFIDADHRYSQLSKDIDNFYPMLNPGGVLCGHDFNSGEYDEKYIEEDFVNGIHHGVTKAVKERFPKVRLFTQPEGGKQRLISSIWHVVKAQEPCLVAMD